ncbi:AlkB Alkylated DNA repair protein [Flavobacteriaceae bacterium]
MKSLFENTSEPIYFNVPDAEIIYYPNFFDTVESDLLFQELLLTIPWQQDDIKVFGKVHAQPRLTALFGNEGKSYSYSNIKMQPHSWNPILQNLKLKAEAVSETEFTTVLLNLYRDGKDSNGWHADNEKELGTNSVIASMSFGAERYFHLQHNNDKNLKLKILLKHGSLLIMKGTTQHFWKHQIPKTAKPIGSRINLTFRSIV